MSLTRLEHPAFAALLLIVVVLTLSACRAQAASCDVCGRDECKALTFRVEYADGGVQVTCCPRCASHAVAQAHGRAVSRLRARDFATGQEIDARSAIYLDGSDVEHCKVHKEEPSPQSCCRVLTYDRCLPSLIAFGSREVAEAFSKEHGGTVRTFEDLDFGKK